MTMIHRHRELLWAALALPLCAGLGLAATAALVRGIPLLAVLAMLPTLVLGWRWGEAVYYLWAVLGAPPEPTVSPFALRLHADRLADLAHALRESRARGAADVQALAHEALNLERAARGFPPLSLYRGTEDVSRVP